MKLNELLDEICMQNKLVPVVDGKMITIYSQTDKPSKLDTALEFSFLGAAGAIAWAPGIENYTNLRFKTEYFDAKLFRPVKIYNDIKNEMFAGFAESNSVSDVKINCKIYDGYIIRYALTRSSAEITAEVTVSNNWLFAQMPIDGILEKTVYAS